MKKCDDLQNFRNKSLNLRYTTYKIKNKDRFGKQTERTLKEQKQTYIFSAIFQAYYNNMFNSPHQNYERNQMLQIESRKQNNNQKAQCFDSNLQFVNDWKNGQVNLDRLFRSQILKEKLSKTWMQENRTEKQNLGDYFQLGENIIRINQSLRYKKVQKSFESIQDDKKDVIIRADFQTGNMSKYFQNKKNQFVIILSNDTNTHGYNQWFHIFIQIKDNQLCDYTEPINFVILNIKKQIYFMDGMKLLTRSFKKQLRNYGYWQRNLPFDFFQSKQQKENGEKCYSIAFSIRRKQLKDGLFVALSFPYPFSRLSYLAEQMKSISSQFKPIEIGRTKLGNPMVVFRQLGRQGCKSGKNIIVLSRQHASQTSSSYISEFIIKRLTLFNCYDKILSEVNWHIIPIANPDGVIHGNTRTSINGYDINRCWAHYLLSRSSQAESINNYLSKIKPTNYDIFLDLHTHTRDLGCFSYFNAANQFSTTFNDRMTQLCQSYDTQKCIYGYDISKKNTFRVQMKNRFSIKNIVTFQTSYYGYICKQTQRLVQYSINDYQIMADGIIRSIQQFLNRKSTETSQSNLPAFNKQVQGLQKLNEKIESESDSDPEGDYLNEQERKQIQNQEQIIIYQNKQAPQNNNNNVKRDLKNRKSVDLLSKLGYKNKYNKNTVSQTKIVNLYDASNQNDKVRFKQDKERITSAKLKTFYCNKNEYLSQNNNKMIKLRQQQNVNVQINKIKIYKDSLSKSFYNRQSFKNLFASAQMRSFNSTRQRSISQDQESLLLSKGANKSIGNIACLKQKHNLEMKTIVNNINFPLKIKDQEEQKILKTLQMGIYKIKKGKKQRVYQGEKKSSRMQTSKVINEKLVQLCELAKNIDKFTCL